MQRKNGIDEYGIFLVWLAIALIVISYFINSSFLNILSFILIVYALFRSFSANLVKRKIENQTFLKNVVDPVKNLFSKDKKTDHKYISCPSCGQKLRIPKDKGNIKVRCPKCKEKFDARS